MNTFIKSSLRGSGQVLFQGNGISGLCFLIAVFIASAETGFYALTGLIVSTLFGRIWKGDTTDYRAGLYGYNGMLIGAMAGSILVDHKIIITIFGAIASVVLRSLTKKPVLTFPFVLVSWIAVFLIPVEAASSAKLETIELFLHNFSEIFLVGNVWSGLLVLIGLLINSFSAAYWGFLASLLTIFINRILDVQILGFSAVLATIAIGSVFPLKFRKTLTLAGIIISVFLHFPSYGFPVFTSPFILVVWTILSLYKFLTAERNLQ